MVSFRLNGEIDPDSMSVAESINTKPPLIPVKGGRKGERERESDMTNLAG